MFIEACPGAPGAARALAAWLDGQRLLRERLLAVLAVEGVQPFATKGEQFDPQHHVALKVAHDPAQPSGQILAVERRGYRCGDRVLRYAEVVVNRSEDAAAAPGR